MSRASKLKRTPEHAQRILSRRLRREQESRAIVSAREAHEQRFKERLADVPFGLQAEESLGPIDAAEGRAQPADADTSLEPPSAAKRSRRALRRLSLLTAMASISTGGQP